jgi:glutathione S-transferase
MAMWTLKTSRFSPFGRKVEIGAALCGLSDRIHIEPADTVDPADPIRQVNPLGKIPALVRDGDGAIYDSRVILEFLDMEAGGGVLIPESKDDRLAALVGQALADGVLDAALLLVYEGRYRSPDERSIRWTELQSGKITRGLAAFEAEPPALIGAPHVGQIALACALGYLDLRFEGKWRKGHPALLTWLDGFAAAVPSFEATRAT